MSEAPRDGRLVFARAAERNRSLLCYWEADPLGLAGPAWIEMARNAVADPDAASAGYLDRYFSGWIDPSHIAPVAVEDVPRLLVAYIDDAREVDDRDALRLLENPLVQDEVRRSAE
jgi:hypothetical protein